MHTSSVLAIQRVALVCCLRRVVDRVVVLVFREPLVYGAAGKRVRQSRSRGRNIWTLAWALIFFGKTRDKDQQLSSLARRNSRTNILAPERCKNSTKFPTQNIKSIINYL